MAITECALLRSHEGLYLVFRRLETVTDFFNRMVRSAQTRFPMTSLSQANAPHRACHEKCISTRYHEQDLNKGETVCIDRCVAKFVEVQKRVGEKLQRGANQGSTAQGGPFGTI